MIKMEIIIKKQLNANVFISKSSEYMSNDEILTNNRPSQIVYTVTAVHVTFMQMALPVHKNRVRYLFLCVKII